MREGYTELIIPPGYQSKLSLKETEVAIKEIKDFFERALAKELNLIRVSAPLFVTPESGLNDNLSGVEKPVDFLIKAQAAMRCEIVQSLAKWKRMALQKYEFEVGEGLYTDMNAIRKDDDLDNLHSAYVDQWDWEKIITREQRTEETLKKIVAQIYRALKATEDHICGLFPVLDRLLPEEIAFISTQELEDRYPTLTPEEREDAICKEKGAVFLKGIGGRVNSGKRHDGRAPDYDDWRLNGDIIFWYPLLETAFEISSMGIRVDEETLLTQLRLTGCEERSSLKYHQDLLAGRLPYTIGGGLGQSRICMFFLQKAHIGEVQASVWSEATIEACQRANIPLL